MPYWLVLAKIKCILHFALPKRTINLFKPEMTSFAGIKVVEQCCSKSVLDSLNGQTFDFILKPAKVIESRTYMLKKTIWSATDYGHPMKA